MQGLTEGRMVHYVVEGGSHRPAIVVNANPHNYPENVVNLVVFLDAYEDLEAVGRGVTDYHAGVGYDPDGSFDTWHWIERA